MATLMPYRSPVVRGREPLLDAGETGDVPAEPLDPEGRESEDRELVLVELLGVHETSIPFLEELCTVVPRI
jgi:hypothetical protein